MTIGPHPLHQMIAAIRLRRHWKSWHRQSSPLMHCSVSCPSILYWIIRLSTQLSCRQKMQIYSILGFRRHKITILYSLVSHLFSWRSFKLNPLPLILTLVCIVSILFSIHFYITYKESLFENQELLLLVIISFILMTLMFDSRVIL